MTDLDSKIFVAQKAFIEKNGKVLVLRDPAYVIDGQVGLDFPGGRFRYGVDPHEELKREIAEETGLEVEIGRPFMTWANINHKRVSNKFEIYLIGFECKYKSGEVTLSEEHDGFEWVDEKSYNKWKEDSSYFQALEQYFRFKKGV